ncbi:MAG: FAD-dependent oxidoreductase [Deltaproteobacteria bacterium]|nr:MAG: FAD-dependent oxidoreductase [Deltaproteobacteria bacterium]
MATFYLTHRQPCGEQLVHLRFDEAPQGFTEPGQFVVIGTPGHTPSYFAIASSPGEPLELLVKDQPGVAAALCHLAPGDPVEISEAQGPGFRAAQTRPLPLVCLVNGSAISAVRPVLRAELDAGLPRPVHLLFGVLSPAHLPFANELRTFREQGIDVQIVLDSPAPAHDEPVGFVQDHAETMGLIHPEVAVLLCGVPPMIEDARTRYAAVGHNPTRILLNF